MSNFVPQHDIIGPRISQLGVRHTLLLSKFTPEQEQRIKELLAELETIFNQAEKQAA